MSESTTFYLGLFVFVAGALIVFLRYEPPALVFSAGVLQSLGTVIVPLILVSAFIERAVEVVLKPARGGESKRLRTRISTSRAAGDETVADDLEARLVEHRLGTRRRAFLLAVGFGLLASVLGLRSLTGLLAPEPAPITAFQFFDVVLTGLVIGGGADGIHKAVKAVTDALEMASRKSEEGKTQASVDHPVAGPETSSTATARQ